MGHELIQVDAGQGRRHQPEHRQGREAAAHGGLTGKYGAPALLTGHPVQLAAGISDGHKMPDGLLLAQGLCELGAHGLEQHARLDGAAAFGRDDDQRAIGATHGEHLAHAHRRIGVQRLEGHTVGVRLVVLGDGHRGLGGAALADEHDGVDALGHGLVSEGLHGGQVTQGVRGQVGPAHVLGGALLRSLGELVERGILGVDAARGPGLH